MAALQGQVEGRTRPENVWAIARNVAVEIARRVRQNGRKEVVFAILREQLVLPDLPPELIVDRKDVALRGEEVLFAHAVDRVVEVEEQIKVLARLGEKKGLLAILQRLVVDVVDGGVAALRLGVKVQARQNVSSDVKIKRVFRRLKRTQT